METLVSIEKAAEILSISPWTVRLWVSQGKLGSAKLGSRRLIPASEVERLISRSLERGQHDSRKETGNGDPDTLP